EKQVEKRKKMECGNLARSQQASRICVEDSKEPPRIWVAYNTKAISRIQGSTHMRGHQLGTH
ncbi:hypothetical protein PIB30_107631, partial [Stylosanthes scabra]|nr:hypothetical protein [Stylosanthes scabra]